MEKKDRRVGLTPRESLEGRQVAKSTLGKEEKILPGRRHSEVEDLLPEYQRKGKKLKNRERRFQERSSGEKERVSFRGYAHLRRRHFSYVIYGERGWHNTRSEKEAKITLT